MSVDHRLTIRIVKLFFVSSILTIPCYGSDGEPVAIRFWDGGVVTLETNWNLVVRLDAQQEADANSQPSADLPSADLRLSLGGSTVNITGKDRVPQEIPLASLDHYLDRVANQTQTHLSSASETTFVSANAVRVSSLGGQFVVVAVDGVHVLAVPKPSAEAGDVVRELAKQNLPTFDAILELQPNPDVKKIAAIVKARQIIRPNPDSSSGNTVAVSRLAPTSDSAEAAEHKTIVVDIGTSPWEMPGELSELFAKKETACWASQTVFEELSVAQLNFKPSNGTHTPRWNAEHMMGRELLFFSQIYGQIEPAIAVVDLNPKQMPPDYQAAHPDWTGLEEARQMERVSAFSRRFAYLLRDLDLDKKPAGSFWTPRGLLKQMQRHYDEHTANVVKKFELEEWPKE